MQLLRRLMARPKNGQRVAAGCRQQPSWGFIGGSDRKPTHRFFHRQPVLSANISFGLSAIREQFAAQLSYVSGLLVCTLGDRLIWGSRGRYAQ